MAGVEPRVKVALWHLGHVELVEELTLVPLLAQPPVTDTQHTFSLAPKVLTRISFKATVPG
jgi:hypothetical protein